MNYFELFEKLNIPEWHTGHREAYCIPFNDLQKIYLAKVQERIEHYEQCNKQLRESLEKKVLQLGACAKELENLKKIKNSINPK